MKIFKIIILPVMFSALLSIINFYSLAAGHDVMYLVLPFLIDPITHFAVYVGWLSDLVKYSIIQLYILFPIAFWPIILCLLLATKKKIVQNIILSIIYLIIILSTFYRLITEPGILHNYIGSFVFYFELIGIILFILGQIGIFYLLRLKKGGRLH